MQKQRKAVKQDQIIREFPGGPVDRTRALTAVDWVQTLVEELKRYKMDGMAKRRETKQKTFKIPNGNSLVITQSQRPSLLPSKAIDNILSFDPLSCFADSELPPHQVEKQPMMTRR